MKYIIMADGKMSRWKETCNIPKHLIKIDDETLIERIVRQLNLFVNNAEIIITSHDDNYNVNGATRYEPINNTMEIDRFTWELINDEVCFLYGDTFYSNEAIRLITSIETEKIFFVGTKDALVSVIVKNAELFKRHIDEVKDAYKKNIITECKGWQVYQSYTHQLFENTCYPTNDFTLIDDDTCGFNTLEEYMRFIKSKKHKGALEC